MYKPEDLKKAKGWLEDAKRGSVEINFWYTPLAEAFEHLAKKVRVHGHWTGLWSYNGNLYETYAGSGDCEERLRYIGPIK